MDRAPMNLGGRRDDRQGGNDRRQALASQFPGQPIQSTNVEVNQRASPTIATARSEGSVGPNFRTNASAQQAAGWESVTLRISGIPPRTRTGDLYEHFSKYGDLVYINILDEVPRDKAFLTFVPIPRGPFWTRLRTGPGAEVMAIGKNKEVYQIQVKLLTPKPRWVTNPKTKRSILERTALFPTMVQFGVMTGGTTMESMKSLNISPHEPALMNFDLRTRRLDMVFNHQLGKPQPTQQNKTVKFKGEIVFYNITKIFAVKNPNNSYSLVIVLPSPPLFFQKRVDVDYTHGKGLTWGEADTWRRVTDIVYDVEQLKGAKTSLIGTNRDIDIGRWTVYQMTLPVSDNKSWENLRDNLYGFNVRIIDIEHANFYTKLPRNFTFWNLLDGYDTQHRILGILTGGHKDYHLPFAVRYQLEACISQGVLVENNITEEFLEKLAQLSEQKRYLSNAAADLLTYVSDLGETVYDTMSIFKNRKAMLYRPIFQLPDYCDWVRKVTVTPTTIYLSSPAPESTNRVLRQYKRYSDRFLRVQFTEEKTLGKLYEDTKAGTKDAIFERISRTMKNGIYVGGRHYEFLAFGNSQFRERGAYFFHPTTDLTCEHIRSWMGDFSHIRIVAKFAARMGQCLSTTRTVQNLPAGVRIDEVPDIEHNGWCFTDGVGRLSLVLAKDIADSLKIYDKGQVPSAFQFRLGGSKGLLVTWPQSIDSPTEKLRVPLGFNNVQLRPSQKKFNTDYSKGIEIIKGSGFSVATLNRQTITILRSLGVPDQVFVDMAKQQDAKYQAAILDENIAKDLLKKHSDANNTNETLREMVKSGFMRTQEPCVIALLHSWIAWSQKQLKEKARLVIEQGALLFGCVDETNTLQGWHKQTPQESPGLPQIFVQVPESDESRDYVVKTGICVVGRNPSLHPGDLRVVEAVDVPQLHHLRNVVVFPANGDRDIPSMCSGGDLDGDDFFVFWDPRLMPTENNVLPMNNNAAKPVQLDRDVEISDIQDFFVEHIRNNSLSMIAQSHLAHADKYGAKYPDCIKLAHLHSLAVDYIKSGQPAKLPRGLQAREWPHFMEKSWRTCHSDTALGRIYDFVHTVRIDLPSNLPFDYRLLQRYDLGEEELLNARAMKSQYDTVLRRTMKQHDVDTEMEIFTTFVLSRNKLGTDYKRYEDIGRVRDALHDRFTKAAIREAGPKHEEKFRRFVAACYRVTWEQVQRARMNRTSTLVTFPWVFHRELCSIATETERRPLETTERKAGSTTVSKLELSVSPGMSGIWDKDISAILDRLSRLDGTADNQASAELGLQGTSEFFTL